ncbi:MAG: serine/threonine transporter SstT [Lachnospiraceae bacterium]|nr:serine/threonine transporter SstT [Lachnospiraceae bacterium]
MKKVLDTYNNTSLILRIIIGIIVGVILAFAVPQAAWIEVLGDLFVGALKAIAPVLVAVLVASSLCQDSAKLDSRFALVIFFYLFSTYLASFTAVLASFAFPQTITLSEKLVTDEAAAAPGGLGEIVHGLLMSIIANPVEAVSEANYLGILFWAVVAGIALKRFARSETQIVLVNFSDAVTQIVRWIINLAPFGICGLVFSSVAENGMDIFVNYGRLIILLVGTMLTVALIINPLIVGIALRTNPYPLVLRCIRESGFTAFFTRSSAANIPVNMELCRKLGLDKDMYSVSIPLGSTVNMDGASVTITIMTLATVHTLGIDVSLPSAALLSFISALAACGTSGVTGGSLLLIPMACSLFGISDDISMQVVGVGFIIGVVQDSMETAINSSGDALFTATAEYVQWKKEGKSLPTFLGGNTRVGL